MSKLKNRYTTALKFIWKTSRFGHALFFGMRLRDIFFGENRTMGFPTKGRFGSCSDNICYPAKTGSRSYSDLNWKGVERNIFNPIGYLRIRRTSRALSNSYNCPVVTGISDVLRNAMAIEAKDRHSLRYSKTWTFRMKSCFAVGA